MSMNINENAAIAIITIGVLVATMGAMVLDSYFDSLTLRECYEAAKTNKDIKCEK